MSFDDHEEERPPRIPRNHELERKQMQIQQDLKAAMHASDFIVFNLALDIRDELFADNDYNRQDYLYGTLTDAIWFNKPDEVLFLINHPEVDINHQHKGIYAPVIAAARQGRPEILQILLDHGANPDAVDHHNISALTLAQRGGHHEVEAILTAKLNPQYKPNR